jgi:GxxExxY protein
MCIVSSGRDCLNLCMKNACVSNSSMRAWLMAAKSRFLVYKKVRLECGYRMDIVVEHQLIVEIKAVERLLPIHEAQMLTYLRLGGHQVALLMNFNTVALKDGLRRFVL